MRHLPVTNRQKYIAMLALLIPVATYPQSLGNLLNTLKQVTSTSTAAMEAIQSISEVVQAQLPAGASAQNADGKVIMYRSANCGYCKRAAAYMRQKNIPFAERDIDRNATYKAEFKNLGGYGVPLIVFGDKAIAGFSEAMFDKNYADFLTARTAAPQEIGKPPTTGNALQAGQPMAGKIAGIPVLIEPSKSAAKLMTLSKTDEIIYMGEERDGHYRVTTSKGEGWVDKLLVKKL